MLLRQDFGGCHHTGLVAVVKGQEHHHESHDGLPAAHIALEQAVHLMTAAHVDADLTDHALLRVGQRKGEVVLIERIEVVANLAEDITPAEALAAFLGPQQLELEE